MGEKAEAEEEDEGDGRLEDGREAAAAPVPSVPAEAAVVGGEGALVPRLCWRRPSDSRPVGAREGSPAAADETPLAGEDEMAGGEEDGGAEAVAVGSDI